jgi:phage tail protein X
MAFNPPEEIDATDHLLSLTLNELHAIKDRDGSSDEFVDAVAWGHYGPFEVRVVDAVQAYFGVSQLGEITQQMLDAAKAGELPALETQTPDVDRTHLLQSWMLTYGAYALLFACEAENITHAIEQCENANPGEAIIGAFKVPTACLGQAPSIGQVDHVREMVTQQTAQAAAALA